MRLKKKRRLLVAQHQLEGHPRRVDYCPLCWPPVFGPGAVPSPLPPTHVGPPFAAEAPPHEGLQTSGSSAGGGS